MAFSIKINNAEKIVVQESNTTMLSVGFSIMDGDETVTTMRHGYDLSATPDDINADLKGVLDAYISDADNATRNAVVEAQFKQADETITEITGIEITSDTTAGETTDAVVN